MPARAYRRLRQIISLGRLFIPLSGDPSLGWILGQKAGSGSIVATWGDM